MRAAFAALALVAAGSVTGLSAPAAAAPGPAPASRWQFDEGTGQTAADSAGAHPATLTGGATWGPGIQGSSALVTNGAGAFADTGATIIDTAQSFTVSAWVKLNRVTGYQTVVSVDG